MKLTMLVASSVACALPLPSSTAQGARRKRLLQAPLDLHGFAAGASMHFVGELVERLFHIWFAQPRVGRVQDPQQRTPAGGRLAARLPRLRHGVAFLAIGTALLPFPEQLMHQVFIEVGTPVG